MSETLYQDAEQGSVASYSCDKSNSMGKCSKSLSQSVIPY